MKILFKSALTLTFLSIVAVVLAVLLSAMKKLYIESWFVLNPSVVVGLISGLLLTTILSLANFHQLQRSHAKVRSALLKSFQAESAAFVAFACAIRNDSQEFKIPDQLHQELELALARLDELSIKITRSEHISPLKSKTIQAFSAIVTPIARIELLFDQAFAPFAESCAAAYHAHSILPYLGDEAERQATQAEFLHNLQRVCELLQPEGMLYEAMQQYQSRLRRLLGVRQAISAGKSGAE